MIIPDPHITLGELWLVGVGFVFGLYVAAIVFLSCHRRKGGQQ